MAQSPEILKRRALSEETDPGERNALLQEAWEMDTSNHEYRYELAMSCITIGFQREAIKHLQIIYALDEGIIYPDNLYHQARMFQRLGELPIAEELYEKYVRRHAGKACADCIKESKNELEKIKKIRKQKKTNNTLKHPENLVVDSIGLAQRINMDNQNHTQHIVIGTLASGLTVREFNNETSIRTIPFSSIQSTEPNVEERILMKDINAFSIQDSILCSLSSDGIFTFTDTSGTAISSIPAFTHHMAGYKESMPTLNAQHDRLYFSSNRPGGFGGMDIWLSRREGNIWLPPENCGKKCNTKGDEVFPVAHADKLFFSSDGQDGRGGLDVFMWYPKTDQLLPIGEPISSSTDDVGIQFFSLAGNKQYVAWSSNRPIQDTADACCYYVWYAELMTRNDSVAAPTQMNRNNTVSNDLVRKPLRLYFHNDEPDPRSKQCETNKAFDSCLNSYLVRKQEYLKHAATTSENDLLSYFFDNHLRASAMRMDSLFEEILQTMQEGMNAALFVRGYASTRASSEYNKCLSERRVSAFKNSLVRWNNGVLLPYLNATQDHRLVLITRPLGEDTTGLSSGEEIYTYNACLSRRIEAEQLLSGDGDLLAPTQIQWKQNENHVSFTLVNISNYPLFPRIYNVPDDWSIEGQKEIPPQQEATIYLRRLNTKANRESQRYNINLIFHEQQQVEIRLTPSID